MPCHITLLGKLLTIARLTALKKMLISIDLFYSIN